MFEDYFGISCVYTVLYGNESGTAADRRGCKASALAARINIAFSRPLCTEGEIHPTDLVPMIAPT